MLLSDAKSRLRIEGIADAVNRLQGINLANGPRALNTERLVVQINRPTCKHAAGRSVL
jgi:hypothetical protein